MRITNPNGIKLVTKSNNWFVYIVNFTDADSKSSLCGSISINHDLKLLSVTIQIELGKKALLYIEISIESVQPH